MQASNTGQSPRHRTVEFLHSPDEVDAITRSDVCLRISFLKTSSSPRIPCQRVSLLSRGGEPFRCRNADIWAGPAFRWRVAVQRLKWEKRYAARGPVSANHEIGEASLPVAPRPLTLSFYL